MLKSLQKFSMIACTVTASFFMPLLSKAQIQGDQKAASRVAKVTPDLLRLQSSNAAPTPPLFPGEDYRNEYVTNGNLIAIEAVANDMNGQNLLDQLQGLGLTGGVAHKSMIFGFLPIDKLDDLKNIASLGYARPYYKPINNAGAVTSQGDKALKADLARQTYGVSGAGSKVGVISDTYNALGGAAKGVASGDLPAEGVQIIDDFTPGTDEGRAMAEIVHDVAPGAAIAFNTANRGQAGFAKGIIDLAVAGCNIIVDDVIYFAEPFFQDGIIGQAADQVVANNNVTYFSAAGNQARSSYQAKFVNSGITIPGYGIAHDFGGGDIYQKVTVPSGGTLRLAFQWDDPFRSVSGGAGAKSDLDILFFRSGTIIGGSAADNIANGDPVEVTGTYTNSTTAPVDIDVVIVKYAGPDPGLVKWVNFGSRTVVIEYDTRSGASFGHSGASRAIAVGAAPYFSTPAYNPGLTTAVIETFSSAGGTPILFDGTGKRISQDGIIREKPEITSVDGGNNTFFSSDYEPDGFPNFFGTSAAAPHAAAVAALMQERAKNKLSPSSVLSIMKQTALDMDDPLTPNFDTGFDYRTGYGFIQADKALQASGSNDPLAITSFTCNTTNSVLSSVDFVVGYPNGTFTPAVAPLFINGVTGAGQLGVKYNYSFDNNQNTLEIRDAATRSTYFVWNFRQACATPAANQPPVFNGITSLTGTVGLAFRYNVPATSFTDPEGSPLTFSVQGLPAGLTFDSPTRVISGTATTAGVSSVTVTATDIGALATSGTFTIAISQTAVTPTTPPSLAITSFTCNTTNSVLSSVDFVVGYADGTFAPALPPLFINGVTGEGQLGVRYSYSFDANQNTLPIQDAATRSTYFVWNFRAACGNAPVANRPPVYNGGLTDQVGTVNVPFTYTVPANAFTDPDGQATLRFTATNLPTGLSINVTTRVISGTPTAVGSRTVTVRATDASSAFASGTFVITIGSTPPVGFAIASVNTLSCVATSASERQLTFTPQYTGTTGQPITFAVVNETNPTTAPAPYTVRLYTDNPTVTLRAEQAGTAGVAIFSYNWLAACNASARIGAAERKADLTVTLLENPATQNVEVEVRGAMGESLNLQVFDEQGRSITKQTVGQAAEVERQSLQLGSSKGLYLLKVNTASQTKTVRVLKN